MEQLTQHMAGGMHEWPSQQLQALEIVINSPFINSNSLLYVARSLFEKEQPVRTVPGLILSVIPKIVATNTEYFLSLIHISEPTRPY